MGPVAGGVPGVGPLGGLAVAPTLGLRRCPGRRLAEDRGRRGGMDEVGQAERRQPDGPEVGVAGEAGPQERQVAGEADEEDPYRPPGDRPAAAGVVDEDGRRGRAHTGVNVRDP